MYAGDRRNLGPGLSRIQLSAYVEVIEVEERIEDQEIAPDGLATIHRVVGKQYDVSLAERGVDDSRTLRHIVAVEKARSKQVALVAEPEHYARTQDRWNDRDRISELLVGDGRCLPRLYALLLRYVSARIERESRLLVRLVE